jgi:hypothetical protein
MHARSTPLNLSLVSPNLCGRAVRAAASLPRLLLLPGHGQSPRVRDHSSTPSGSDSPARYDTLLVDPPISGLFFSFLIISCEVQSRKGKELRVQGSDPIHPAAGGDRVPISIVHTHSMGENRARIGGGRYQITSQGREACLPPAPCRKNRASEIRRRPPQHACVRDEGEKTGKKASMAGGWICGPAVCRCRCGGNAFLLFSHSIFRHSRARSRLRAARELRLRTN